MKRLAAAALAAVAAAGVGCSSTDTASKKPARPDATQTTSENGGSTAALRLVSVAKLDQPVALAVRPNDDALYIAERTGRVRTIPKGQTATPDAPGAVPVLDLSKQIATTTEQGLLGLAFAPDGAHLYVDYTDTTGDTHIDEYAFVAGRADLGSRRQLLFVKDFAPNHNGGDLVFGPDGFLYISQGDGGGAGDPQGNGQKLSTLLGKILRIDPRPDGDKPYRIPPDNPFASRADARPEIWAYGLRNPWRFSFDRTTGDLWIGDVGQNTWEEVDRLPKGSQAGANLGWNLREGPARFRGEPPKGAIEPVHSYQTKEGCSVVGGYVYRGSRIRSLSGSYLFGDACTGKVTTLSGLPIAREGGIGGTLTLDLAASPSRSGEVRGYSIASFGEDTAGELYVLSLSGDVLRIGA